MMVKDRRIGNRPVLEAPWSAVAAGTAFLSPHHLPLSYERKAEGGSCCYRSKVRREARWG